MQGYYLFSDECGSYQKERSEKFIARHPFYVRSSVLISFDDYRLLEQKSEHLKELLSIDAEVEIKWAETGQRFNNRKSEGLEELSDEAIFKYIESIIKTSANLKSVKLFFSVFDNKIKKKYEYQSILKMHIQNALQRAQKDAYKNDYITVIIDDINERINKPIKEIVHSMLVEGDFQEYRNIKKSILVDYSHHCIGLQLADYCAGVFTACLKRLSCPNNYSFANDLFYNYLYQKIRNDSTHLPDYVVYAYGVREVPNGCGKEVCEQISKGIENKLKEDLQELIQAERNVF